MVADETITFYLVSYIFLSALYRVLFFGVLNYVVSSFMHMHEVLDNTMVYCTIM